jgi:hypothetical protein
MKHTRITPYLAAVAAAFFTLAPVAAAGPKDGDKKPVRTIDNEEYRLGPGDKLGSRSGSAAVAIGAGAAGRHDHLPLIGDMDAASHTRSSCATRSPRR